MQGGSFPVLCFVALHAEFAQLINKDEKDLILNENTTRVIDSLSQNSNPRRERGGRRRPPSPQPHCLQAAAGRAGRVGGVAGWRMLLPRPKGEEETETGTAAAA